MKVVKIGCFVVTLMMMSFIFSTVNGQSKEQEKIDASAKVLKDFSQMKESIPQELLKVTQGIIVVPKLINAGFVFRFNKMQNGN